MVNVSVAPVTPASIVKSRSVNRIARMEGVALDLIGVPVSTGILADIARSIIERAPATDGSKMDNVRAN